MPDHAERAIRCAVEMNERLDEFNSERREGPHLRIRIGVNTGRAVAGEIGSINKTEYTVLGDTVNTASRLESSIATPGTIVIGPATYEAVKDDFRCRCLGTVSLKGKEQTVVAYEVEGAVTPAGEA
jgi:adenylate cyclase